MSDTVARWEGFVKKICGRYAEALDEYKEGVAGLAEEDPTDWRSVNTATNAFQVRLVNLRQKLNDTWSDKVSDTLSGGGLDKGHRLLSQTDDRLEMDWHRTSVEIQAQFYENMLPHVEQLALKKYSCTQCSAEMDTGPIKAAKTVTCEHCDAANQLLPDTTVATFYSIAPDHLAQHAALEEFMAKAAKPSEKLERAYWQKYIEVKCQYDPAAMPAEERARYVDSRVEQWLKYR